MCAAVGAGECGAVVYIATPISPLANYSLICAPYPLPPLLQAAASGPARICERRLVQRLCAAPEQGAARPHGRLVAARRLMDAWWIALCWALRPSIREGSRQDRGFQLFNRVTSPCPPKRRSHTDARTHAICNPKNKHPNTKATATTFYSRCQGLV